MSASTDPNSSRWGVSARPELGLDIWLDNSKDAKVNGDPKIKQSVLVRTITKDKRVRSALFHISNEVTLIPTFSQGPDFASIAQENFEDDQVIYNRPTNIPPLVAQAVANRRLESSKRSFALPAQLPFNLPFNRKRAVSAGTVQRSSSTSIGSKTLKAVKGVSFGMLAVFILLVAFQVMQLRVVLSGSMLPVLKIGDVVVVESTKYRQPKVNDIVLYTARALDGTPVTTYAHRIIDGTAKDGWTIKGDNNPQPDYGIKKNEDVKGVVLFTIPKLGRLLSPIPIALLLIGMWLISIAVAQLRKIMADQREY
jgi:signal peptidase I